MKNLAFVLSIACAIVVPCVLYAQESSQPKQKNGAVQAQMHNVMYHFTDNVSVDLRNLGGELIPASADRFPIFDDKHSFTLQIAAAEIAMAPQSLANALNSNV